MAPFEPQESAFEKCMTLKVFFLLVIVKRVEDPACQLPPPAWLLLLMESKLFFILGWIMSLRPSSVPRYVVLQAFYPLPFQSAEQARLNFIGPVWALSSCRYVHSLGQWRKTEQLFVCFGAHSRGSVASKPCTSNDFTSFSCRHPFSMA